MGARYTLLLFEDEGVHIYQNALTNQVHLEIERGDLQINVMLMDIEQWRKADFNKLVEGPYHVNMKDAFKSLALAAFEVVQNTSTQKPEFEDVDFYYIDASQIRILEFLLEGLAQKYEQLVPAICFTCGKYSGPPETFEASACPICGKPNRDHSLVCPQPEPFSEAQ